MVDRFGLPIDENEEEVVEMTNIFTIPTVFERCMSPEEQLLWLFVHKQDKLVAGDNITLTRNEDGTVTISAQGTTGSTYRIAEVEPDEGYVKAYALIDIATGRPSGDKINIPEGGSATTPVITATASVDSSTGTPSVDVSKTGTDEAPNFAFAFHNLKGETGGRGPAGEPGQSGSPGEDGFSPEVSITSITGGHRVTITDADHPQGQSFDVMDGDAVVPDISAQASVGTGTGIPTVNVSKSGTADAPVFTFAFDNLKGANGLDGVSPTVTVSSITGGHHIEIVSAGSTESFDIMDGVDGQDGTDGISPTITVRSITDGHQIEIVSAGSTETFDVMDGAPGAPGANGISPEVTLETITGGHRVTITDADHPQGQSFDIVDGVNGVDAVSPLITITSITGGHNIIITDAGHPQGQSFNVMDGINGTDGDDGYSPIVTITSVTGGHTVNITDATHPQGQSFTVLDGVDGSDGISPTVTVRSITGGHQIEIVSAGSTETFDVMDGSQGQQGNPGPAGPGVPAGGTDGQVLTKDGSTDYATKWATPSGGVTPISIQFYDSIGISSISYYGGSSITFSDSYFRLNFYSQLLNGMFLRSCRPTMVSGPWSDERPNQSFMYFTPGSNYIPYIGRASAEATKFTIFVTTDAVTIDSRIPANRVIAQGLCILREYKSNDNDSSGYNALLSVGTYQMFYNGTALVTRHYFAGIQKTSGYLLASGVPVRIDYDL